MVRAQQKSVLRSGMAAKRLGNPGGSKLQLVNPEILAPEQKPVICRQLSGSDSDSYCRANRAPEKSYLYDTQTETLVVDCVLDHSRHRYCFDVALGFRGW